MSYIQQSTLNFSNQAAWDRVAYWALRPQLYFDQVADVRAERLAMPGKSVNFTIVNDLAIATTALSETSDPTPVTMTNSTITLTLAEYGNSVISTALARGTSFVDLDPVLANAIGYNAGVSLDTLARAALNTGITVANGNVMFGSGGGATAAQTAVTARSAVSATSTIASVDIRSARARLRSANVMDFDGFYNGLVHPDVVADIQGESFTTTTSGNVLGWRPPHVNTDGGNEQVWNGEIGVYEGCRFIETPRAPVFQGAGASSANVFGTILVGRQSLAKAHSIVDGNGEFPAVVDGPITDLFRRLVPLGWYWLGAYGSFRTAAAIRIETGSTLGADYSTTVGTGTTWGPAVNLGESGSPLV